MRKEWPVAAACAFQALFLAPVVRTGYLFDDAINSNFTGGLGYEGVSFWAAVWKIVRSWIVESGRFFPLSFYQGYGVFHLVHDVTTYKVLLVAMTAATSASVYWLLRRLGVAAAAAGLVVVLATVSFQFRLYHDPLLAYAGLVQLTLLEVALSAIAFDSWLDTGRRRDLVASIGLLVLAFATYESAYVLVGVHVVVGWREGVRLRDALRRSAAPLGVAGVFLGAAGVLRVLATNAGTSPYSPSTGIGPVSRTFAKQLLGGLPLDHLALDPYALFRPWSTFLGEVDAAAVAVALAAVAITWALTRAVAGASNRQATGRWRRPVLAAIVLGVGAALPLAFAPKYQTELRPGIAHIPVLVEYFAFGTLAAAALAVAASRLPRRASPWLAGAVTVTVASIALVQWTANDVVVDRLVPDKERREALEAALDRGLLDAVPPGATVYAPVAEPWHGPAFYFQHTGKRLRIRTAGDASVACAGATRDAYVIELTEGRQPVTVVPCRRA